MVIPGTGIFDLIHKQTGDEGFFVYLFLGITPLPIVMTLPILIGNMQLQQMSVIGLKKCPVHVILADTENGIKRATISMMLNRVFAP